MATTKGITIEFRGETTKLQKAINDVRKETRSLDKELGYIDNSLKFNPHNVDLLKQKIAVLNKAVDEGEANIKDMKKALEKMEADGIDETSDDYRELQREIIKAESKQKDYNKELRKVKGEASSLGQVSAKFKKLGDNATKVGEALAPLSRAGALVDLALVGLAYKSGKTADDLNTLSKVTGISTEKLQMYSATADLVDVSVEAIAKSQTKLKKSMYQASQGFDSVTIAEDGTIQGGNAMMEAFDKLGVKVTDSEGRLRDQESVFQDTIGALGKMTNETERDALAMQIFGKSASELNPLIEDGGETYAKVSKIFQDNDLQVVDQETLDRANQFNDQIDLIKATGMTAIATIGMKLAGYLAPIMEKISEAIQKVFSWLSSLSPETLTIIGIIAGVIAVLSPLLIIIGKIAFAISSITGLMSTMGLTFGAIAGPVGIAIAVIGALIGIGVLLYKNWDTIKAKAKEFKDKVVAEWKALKDGVVQFVTALKTGVVNMWNALKEKVSSIVTGIKDKVTTTWHNMVNAVVNFVVNLALKVAEHFLRTKEKVAGIVNGIKEKVTTTWSNIKNGVINTVTNFKDGIVSRFEALKTKIKSVVDAIKNFVKERFETIKYNITHPIEHAKDLVTGFITKIKNLFSGLKLQLPHFKLPHFNISGGKVPWGIGGMGVKPTISVDWYDKGGIFRNPSIIGVGEKRPEFVGALDDLRDIVREETGGTTINVYASNGMDVDALVNEIERRIISSANRRRRAWA